jgi:5'-nucleotidase
MLNSNELTKSIIHQNLNILSNQDDINNNNSKRLRIIHFNDVYNIESDTKEPKGGAARFASLVKTLKAQEPSLVLFSGDAFAPSTRNLALF